MTRLPWLVVLLVGVAILGCDGGPLPGLEDDAGGLGDGHSPGPDECLPGTCPALDFWTTQSGVLRVPLEAMTASPATDLPALRLRLGGVKLPVALTEAPDGTTLVLVFVPPSASPFSAETHLFADFAPQDPSPLVLPQPPPRTRAPQAPTITRLREDRPQQAWMATRAPLEGRQFQDNWAGTRTSGGETYLRTLSGFAPTDQARLLRVELVGASVLEHRVDVRLNGLLLGTVRFDAWTTRSGTFALPGPAPDPQGAYTLGLTLLASEESPANAMHYLSARLYYGSQPTFDGQPQFLPCLESQERSFTFLGASPWPAVWDITDPLEPTSVGLVAGAEGPLLPAFVPGHQYYAFDPEQPLEAEGLLPLGDREEVLGQQGDLIIVTPAVFEEALEPLIAKRLAEGWTPVVRSPRELFQAFSGGQPSPEAIRAYLLEALATWTDIPPRALLLVGDATPDRYGDPRPEGRIFTPTNFVWYGAEDLWFSSDLAYLFPPGQDLAPGQQPLPLAIGRLPARQVEELGAAVDRILQYQTPGQGRGFLYLSDDNNAGLFQVLSAQIRDLLPDWFGATVLDLTAFALEYPMPDPPPASQYDKPAVVAMRLALREALEAGQWVVQYFGHGDLYHISGEGLLSQTPNYDNLDEVLVHGGLPPIFLAYNCLSGYFAHPLVARSIGEAMVLLTRADRGVAASISPAAYTEPLMMVALASRLQGHLSSGDGGTLGEALASSVLDLLVQPGEAFDPATVDLGILSFNLMGDPSLPVP